MYYSMREMQSSICLLNNFLISLQSSWVTSFSSWTGNKTTPSEYPPEILKSFWKIEILETSPSRMEKKYVWKARERKVIKKSNLWKFQNECELLQIRRVDYTNYLFEKDNFITCVIEKTVRQRKAKNERLAVFPE